MTNYTVGDFLIQIKNAAMADKRELSVKSTKLVIAAAEVLKKAGYLQKVEEKDGLISIELGYYKKEPKLIDLKLISRPGLRVYKNVDDLEAHRGISKFLLSTPVGVMLSKDALKKRVGGEVIAEIW